MEHLLVPESRQLLIRRLMAVSAFLTLAGCVRPAAVTREAHAIQGRVTPAARAFTDGTRRLVRYAGQAADDAALAAKVKAALTVRKGLDEGEIHVHVEEGAVRLTGRVSSAARKKLAAEVARSTVGVTRVENRLKVLPGATASEE
jgi:osmotically-inducible protein OsmY